MPSADNKVPRLDNKVPSSDNKVPSSVNKTKNLVLFPSHHEQERFVVGADESESAGQDKKNAENDD